MRNSNSNHGHNLVEKLELPQDIVLGVPILTMQGNTELLIENHRGLLQYDTDEIRVRTKTFTVQIEGKELNIQEYRKDLLIIQRLKQVEFLLCT